MRTTRRRSRLRSSQYPGDRWRPSIPAAILVLGIGVGCFLGLRGRWFNQSANLQEHYVLLASDLYAQGAPMPDIRDRLVSIGFTNPSESVLTMANGLASSRDPVQQQESDQLHQFAAALVAGLDKSPVVTPVPGTGQTPVATPVATDTPVATGATPSPAITPPVATPEAATPTAAAAASSSSSSPAPAGTGVVKTNDRKPAVLRKDANARSAAVGLLPYGSTVDILGSVTGEAVNPGDSNWYHVRAGTREGYVYSSLIQSGG